MADARYLSELPTSLQAVGTELLRQVRSNWPGALERSEAGRYVDTPDNFWTVKIQPRDRSLAVTVRGDPEKFGDAGVSLNMKADRKGYSRFKVRTAEDVGRSMAVLRRVSRRP